ncbi:fimbrial protein [Pantoea allii]|uniref:fimbrial protein n=1 Tax=Pantoea allii TaxID=574096 RepID=UPI003D31C320
MKLKLFAAALPALFAMSSYADIEGGSAIIKFTGSVTSSTCEISQVGTDKEVVLGEVASTTLVSNGVSADKAFNIALENCSAVEDAGDALTGAYVIFKGETVDGTVLKTTNDDVGIEVKQNGTALALDGTTKTSTVNFDGTGKAVFDFTANYKNLGGETVAAGDASSTVDFTVYYQ